ncbi:MAG: hypothetical protein JSV81_02195 [Anaerolineales bacterium]|nr:MAG: hypothetical protein JSV81_02195 [Anaerolineales bacterium]
MSKALENPVPETSRATHVRPAQVGDICVLLEPSQPHEINRLRQRQAALQARFGGVPIKHVHLTCQRFACRDKGLLGAFVRNLARALEPLEPFPLTAIALKPRYVSFRQTNILKWEIQVTQELEGFVASVEQALMAAGIAPLYKSGFVSSQITALKDVPEPEPGDLAAQVFPQHLFAAGRVVLSRIDGPNAFELLAELRLLNSF